MPRAASFPLRMTRTMSHAEVQDANIVQYPPDGFVVSPPALRANELIQVQFVVAWSSEPGGSDANWFAVDFSPEAFLKDE